MSYGYYPRYVSVAEKRDRAKKKIRQLRKKNPDIQPIILEGQALAASWWGKAWNKNLERYADYSNRIGRGRSYVRHGAVVDLQIKPGLVTALVVGTRQAPYRVNITIKKIKPANWRRIVAQCQADLSSLPDLLAGKFPKKLQEVFMIQGQGLFPTPEEISFDCSCPDWADMCKHVAATLYGVGARLDEDPALFFTLRSVEMQELVSRAVQDRTDAIISAKAQVGDRVIADDQLADLFGIEFDEVAPEKKEHSGKTAPRKRSSTSKKSIPKKSIRKQRKKQAARNRTPEDVLPGGYGSPANLVFGCIMESSPEGISVQDLAEITAIPKTKLYSILHGLKKSGQVKNPARGMYQAS